MPESHSSSGVPLANIERPLCPQCGTRTMLARFEPGPQGYDYRRFECAKCNHVHMVTVATDPMKSEAAGWPAGELKPPE
jgi:ribosomal protein S27AE